MSLKFHSLILNKIRWLWWLSLREIKNLPFSADVANQKRGGWSQQSENWFWRSKNRAANDFHEKFHVLQDFSIFNDFRWFLASDSSSWRNLLPGDGLGSPESEFPKISLWMNFFIKNVTLIQIFPCTQLPQRIIIWTRDQDRTVQLYNQFFLENLTLIRSLVLIFHPEISIC